MTSNIQEALEYSKSLEGAPYVWWTHHSISMSNYPSYADNEIAKTSLYVKEHGINCVGLINLMRRKVGLPVPGVYEGEDFPGGTYCWFRYLFTKNCLQPFDSTAFYPPGTLLIRNYTNSNSQGHVAVIYDTHPTQGVLSSKLIHSYPSDNIPVKDLHCFPGVTIDETVKTSHDWDPDGFYTHICLPEYWLI